MDFRPPSDSQSTIRQPHPWPDLDLIVDDVRDVAVRCKTFREVFAALRAEIARVIVGQEDTVTLTLVGLFADGHILLEGVPGLGKTLLVRTLSAALDLPFNRIQFTPDLMPADIVGTTVVMESRDLGRRFMQFRPGPIFAQIILADEINRATPRTQSALLEAMQEKRVTVAGTTHTLARPFLVLATQNPIEQEGTYVLPEAQLDRFLLKIVVPGATRVEMSRILARTTTSEITHVRPILDSAHILQAQRLVRRVVVADHVQDFAIRLVLATHPVDSAPTTASTPTMSATNRGVAPTPSITNRYIKIGVSPRGAQALVLTAKVFALIDGRYAVSYRDLERAALPALRHRVMVNFEAEAEGVSSDDVILELLRAVPHESDDSTRQ